MIHQVHRLSTQPVFRLAVCLGQRSMANKHRHSQEYTWSIETMAAHQGQLCRLQEHFWPNQICYDLAPAVEKNSSPSGRSVVDIRGCGQRGRLIVRSPSKVPDQATQTALGSRDYCPTSNSHRYGYLPTNTCLKAKALRGDVRSSRVPRGCDWHHPPL
jgi:hypothetical protein